MRLGYWKLYVICEAAFGHRCGMRRGGQPCLICVRVSYELEKAAERQIKSASLIVKHFCMEKTILKMIGIIISKTEGVPGSVGASERLRNAVLRANGTRSGPTGADAARLQSLLLFHFW